MSKVLLVEDDPDVLDLTAYVLRRERFLIIEAADGAGALRRLKMDRPDLVILDLVLPDSDGFDVLRRIRAENDTPVLVVSGRKDPQDIVRAFSLGSDDFLAKPFVFAELVARIRAILRRTHGSERAEPEPRVELDGLLLDPELCEVTWRDTRIPLTPTEFRILYLLCRNAGRVVPVNRLYAYAWGSGGGDANALRSHISHLRDKLATGRDNVGVIESARAVGYIFKRAADTAATTESPPAFTVAPVAVGPAPPQAISVAASQHAAWELATPRTG